MSWTVLRVVDEGIVLRDHHAARFASCSESVRDSFARFASSASAGCYSLRANGESLLIESRGPSRLVDGQPVRFQVSPFAGTQGPISKPPPPSPYAALRVDGLTTLLTSADGQELYESCAAAIVSWDGSQLVLVPSDRPRVASTAEAAIRESGAACTAAIPVIGEAPIALVNAVKGCCRISAPGRRVFPEEAAQLIADIFASTVRR